LKFVTEEAVRMSDGKLFHAVGPATDLLQTCHLCCGLVSDTTGKSPTCCGLARGKLV